MKSEDIYWRKCSEEPPPEDELLLVWQEMTGRCLRRLNDQGDWYDEGEIYDDSELEITHWSYILDGTTLR